MKSLLHSLGIATLLFGVALFAEIDDARWQQCRKEAVGRPRKVIVNHDGCDMTEYPKELPLTRENIYKQMFDKLKGMEIDTVSFCPFGVGHQLATRSEVTEIHTGSATGKNARNLTPELLAQGTDTMQVAVDFCRANGLEIFACMRVNDCHDQWHPWLSKMKTDHPEWIFGTKQHGPPYGAWTGFDFALPVTRARFRAICAELLTNYDVDGLDLDFCRFPVLFRRVAWGEDATAEETALMTQLMHDIRRDADEIGKKKGRYLLISCRLPDSPALGKSIGMDTERWMQEGLFDIYIPGSDFGRFSPYADSVALARRYGLAVYPSVDTSWVKGPRKGKGESYSRNDIAAYHAQAAAALAAGSDGLYYFNFFYVKDGFRQMHRSPAGYAGYDKRYFANYQNVYRFSRRQHDRDPLLAGRGYGLAAPADRPGSVMMELGDDFAKSTHPAKALLRANVPDATGNERLRASVNGASIGEGIFLDGEFRFHVPTDLLRLGENTFDFSIAPETADSLPAKTILAGDVRPESPWKRLYANDDCGSESVIDGAVRLSDEKRGPGACVNLAYPLPDLTGKPFAVEFDLQVDSSDAPEAAALRLATGEWMETIAFEPGRISLKYAGNSAELDTRAFRHYRAEVTGNALRLYADGALLLEGALAISAHDEHEYLVGNRAAFPLMDNRSIVIGSLSEKGVGASRWRNLRLDLHALPIEDVALDVSF